MFTGIIEAVGRVRAVEAGAGRSRLRVDLSGLTDFDLRPGDSVAINGACLTAAAVERPEATFDCVTETLERTTLGRLRPGMPVNVERAMRLGDRLAGHFVQGHVDGLGAVERLDPQTGQTLLHVRAPDLVAEMVLKGAVAVDGVSLTIARLAGTGFAVALVPFTLEHTTLGACRAGQPVNIETDLIGKHVRQWLRREPTHGLTRGLLDEHGFE